MPSVQEEHAKMTSEFISRACDLGYGDLRNYFWYHTVDLGEGLVTPGVYDYRHTLEAFHFPESMEGFHVLDVGAATGFFSFEFERRGGRVVATEIPSLLDIDKFPGESMDQTLRKIQAMMPAQSSYSEEQCRELFQIDALQQFYQYYLVKPFELCRTKLNSKVTRCYSSIYDLTAEKLGVERFDYIFMGDVLLHTINPLRALSVVADLCRGTLVIAQGLPHTAEQTPLMLYVGGDVPGKDEVSWWWPNFPCLEQILKKLSFAKVELKGYHEGILRPGGGKFRRAIVHASR